MSYPEITAHQHRRQWLAIVATVVTICVLVLTFAIGHRFGRVAGREDAIKIISADLKTRLDDPCFDKLSKSYEVNP